MVLGVLQKMRKRVRRGDMWFIDAPEGVGCEQQGDRVFLAMSTEICHEKSDLVIGILGTRKENKETKKTLQETQFIITTDYGLKYDTVFMAEQIIRIDRQRLKYYCGHLTEHKMQEANKAASIALGMLEPINNKYIRVLIDYINMLDKDLILYKSQQIKILKEERIEELKNYCEEYKYDHRVFLEKYLLFKEVENIG
jgi:mRNA-degrading endonuclease toxin of MazEF toxin-antitoxin module